MNLRIICPGVEYRWSEWFDDPPVNRAGPRVRRQLIEVAKDEKKEPTPRRFFHQILLYRVINIEITVKNLHL